MNKMTSAKEVVEKIRDGDSVMVAGFGPKGVPETLINTLLESGRKNLTLITNAFGMPQLDELMAKGIVTRAVATFIRDSDRAGEMFAAGNLELVPQGTFSERIRAGGVGIPAFFTPTGVGTFVAEGKEHKDFNGKTYIMETALRADVAFIRASVVDESGNCSLRGSTKNFAALMPAASGYTAVEAEKVVPVGGIDPELVTVPGIFVGAIIKLEN